jgi:hypothetical protein
VPNKRLKERVDRLQRGGIHHRRGFLRKSAESIENKGVEFLRIAEKCKKVRKSAEGFEKKELSEL